MDMASKTKKTPMQPSADSLVYMVGTGNEGEDFCVEGIHTTLLGAEAHVSILHKHEVTCKGWDPKDDSLDEEYPVTVCKNCSTTIIAQPLFSP